ncbi:MAG: hypothetical protein RR086_04955 [Clostridia bacterium]
MYYFTKLLWLSIILGLIVGIGATFALYKLIPQKKNNKLSKTKLGEIAFNFAMSSTMTEDIAKALRFNLVTIAEVTTNKILCVKKDIRYKISICMEVNTFSAQKLINLLKETEKFDKLVIMCNSFDKSAYSIIEKLNTSIIILETEQVYYLIKSAKIPLNTSQYKTKRQSVILANTLNKERARYFLYTGLFLCVYSIFSFFKIYTLIFATVSIAVAIYSFFNNKYNNVDKSSELFDDRQIR